MNTKQRIAAMKNLKDKGYTVDIFHRRKENENNRGGVQPKGGITEVSIYAPTTRNLMTKGEAVCSSVEPFVKAKGVNIAFGRALKEHNQVRVDSLSDEEVDTLVRDMAAKAI